MLDYGAAPAVLLGMFSGQTQSPENTAHVEIKLEDSRPYVSITWDDNFGIDLSRASIEAMALLDPRCSVQDILEMLDRFAEDNAEDDHGKKAPAVT